MNSPLRYHAILAIVLCCILSNAHGQLWTKDFETFAFDYLRLYSTATSVAECKNPNASNFNVLATTDNRSCAYPVILEGCTYTGATNYDSSATSDDGSCLFTTSSSCPEDINNDGFVGVSDLLQFIAAYGNSCN
jgi:hypothetical protein